MKINRIISSVLLIVLMLLALASCTVPATAPTIGENGNWFINGVDTGISVGGEDGKDGTDATAFEIKSVDKVSESGDLSTYEIVVSDEKKYQFSVSSGIAPSITGCEAIPEKSDETKTTFKISFSGGFTSEIEITNGKDGEDGTLTPELMTPDQIKNYEIITSATLGAKILSLNADTLGAGVYLRPMKKDAENNDVPARNTVICNKHLNAYLELQDLKDGKSIKVGHGESEYGASFVEITETEVIIYLSGTTIVERYRVKHGLDIKDFVYIDMFAGYGSLSIQIRTNDTKIYEGSRFSWDGRNGTPFVKPVGFTAENVKFNWYSDDLSKSIWLFGDSYFSATDGSRWTSYLVKNGYTNNCLISHSGMSTERGLEEFKYALEFGTPQYVVWCMGMNNGDKNRLDVNSDWEALTLEFIAICEDKGITPILATIPSTPIIFNYAKSKWVKESGYRYIDFEAAVGGRRYESSLIGKEYTLPNGNKTTNSTGNEWYADMIYPDLVHPATLGAQALYMQAITDFPELIRK